MPAPRLRTRSILVATLGVALLASGGFLLLRPAVEKRVKARLDRDAKKVGLSATLGEVHLRPWLSLELRDVIIEKPGRLRLTVSDVVVRPRWSPRGLIGRAANLDLSQVSIGLAADVKIEMQPSAWVLEARPPELRVRRLGSKDELELTVSNHPGGRTMRVGASNAHLSGFLRVLVGGCGVADLGTVDGEGRLDQDVAGTIKLALRARTERLALASLAALGGMPCQAASLSAPTDVEAEVLAVIEPQIGSLRADRLRLAANGAEATGRLAVDGGLADPRLDLQFEVARLDFARLLASTGIELAAADLGSAALAVRVTGRLLDPASLTVTQRLDFAPPSRPLPALTRLQGPFAHRVETTDGRSIEILVSPDSPDFVPLSDVPPLFVKALLLGEDANFFGHRGIDLSELPSAMATNFARGTFARGASTISQQLAKNLFLSRKKTLGRKLEELSLALLLDSTLGKERVLEIYLNVIEWGPGLYGLRPAARHYFGKEPSALSPREMTFLVSLIPGPIKYQQSFATGSPTPFFEGLMTVLLAKLRSVGALSDVEYEAALAEPLALQNAPAQPEPEAPAPTASDGYH
ncbi:MAG TPA: transglycosylase domain-containing protein [Vicinamibacteria bacterium]|nr:transglycosylase domain-containing protein [Vicinamibacteria bacterium]